ncbi:50S ribosomal protein L34e [Candidatus Woesearchaeota archaeon CG_4_10_14_0_8_um_filter_47_5]|nr:MAG: 50S ribosomal protein L34e [Candidatus Woesearchaeota archaeon CG_4_10_14_0_8_um_filter_47_5]
MPAPRYRSRSLRRVYKKTPGGRVVLHYEPRKPKAVRCPETGVPLAGVPRARPGDLVNMPKSKKRPERPYGGVLSSQAMRRKLIKKARSQNP